MTLTGSREPVCHRGSGVSPLASSAEAAGRRFHRCKLARCFLGLALATCGGAAAAAPAMTEDGFAIPQAGHTFSFPADDGAHPDFRIEWWYVTGHLYADAGRRFGFQATFFRLAGPRNAAPTPPDFSRSELYLAHMAVTDVAAGRFLHTERLNRGGWDAHAAVGRLDVTNGPWSLIESVPSTAAEPVGSPRMLPAIPERMQQVFPSRVERVVPTRSGPSPLASPKRVGTTRSTFKLSGSVDADAAFELTLEPAKPLVVFGENGVSRKGAEASAASYYLTFPRLKTTGTLTVGESVYRVDGEAWMDHEISSSQLGSNQVGWDWTCIQLSHSPWELMLYRLRRADGSADPASRLQWVDPGSHAITSDFTWKVRSWWKSPRSGARYPSRIDLTTTSPATHQPITFELRPLVVDQELTNALGGGPYWEGACNVIDAQTGRSVGSAYLELTGYAKALKM